MVGFLSGTGCEVTKRIWFGGFGFHNVITDDSAPRIRIDATDYIVFTDYIFPRGIWAEFPGFFDR
jgi:hypothetical protein